MYNDSLSLSSHVDAAESAEHISVYRFHIRRVADWRLQHLMHVFSASCVLVSRIYSITKLKIVLTYAQPCIKYCCVIQQVLLAQPIITNERACPEIVTV